MDPVLQRISIRTVPVPEIICDAVSAETVWKKLVDPASLYDEWALRINFLDPSESRLHLLTDNPDDPAAMLPLQCKKSDGSLRFIGSPFLERNRGFALPRAGDALGQLYRSLPRGTLLDDIAADDPARAELPVRPSDPAYVLDRAAVNYENRDSLYRFVPKNIRENLRKIGKKVAAGEITVTGSELGSTLARIRDLQRVRFGADSWLESPFIYDAFSNLAEISGSIGATTACISMQAGDAVIAGCISLRYRDTYYMLMEGVNSTASFSGLGSYLHFHCMADAFDAGCQRIDTGIGDCGWKERWGLEPLPQYLFENSV